MSEDGLKEEQIVDEFEIPFIGVKLPRTTMPWLIGGLLAALLLGWSFLSQLPDVWFESEGYYSHGILVPFMTLYVIYLRREQIAKEPVGSSMIGAVLMCLGLLFVPMGRLYGNISIASFGFIVSIIGAVYFVFGKRIAKHCLGPLAFLTFMMPVLGYFIDISTSKLQLVSTKASMALLNLIGFGTEASVANPTELHLNHYTLVVGAPCSGFKLILSLTAFTMFFVMISNLGWKKNLFLVFVVNPLLALFINGLRIALIGVVGERAAADGSQGWVKFLQRYGEDPGMVFHDWSGYITLVVCFVLLHYIVKFLEGKKPDAEAA